MTVSPRIAFALLLLLHAAAARGEALSVAPTPGVTVQPLTVYERSQLVVRTTVPAAFSIPVSVPQGARLVTAVAVADRAAMPALTRDPAPVRFRIVFEDGRTSEVLYERVVDLTAEPRTRRWLDVGRDLAALAGRHGRLRFETEPARPDGPPGTLALWAAPELLACRKGGPNVLLIVLDALRADRLSGAGYPRHTTPYLDAFAANHATRFASAFSGAPKTIPSVPQILTGLYFPHLREQAGLTTLLGAGRFQLSRAVVNNPHVTRWLGNEQPGFQTLVAGELNARAITSEALRFLSAAGSCRTVTYLHYLDTHTPYRPPPRYARRFIDPHAPTVIGLTFDDVTGAWQGRYASADRQRIADLYASAIAWTDRQLGRLFRGLARRGRLADTVVVVTADHGEELWDHGWFFHGQSLYDELLHVPLLVHVPGLGNGRVVDDLVSTLDILPTVAEAAGLPPIARDGRSLLSSMRGSQDPAGPARAVFATVSYAEPRTPERQAVRTRNRKLVRNVSDGTLEVYDLADDPRERNNLGAAAPDLPALAESLDAVRLRLADAGYQLRLTSASASPVSYKVVLATDPPAPIVATDRLTLEADDRLVVGPGSRTATLVGTLEAGGEDHVRMDVLARTGRLTLTVTLEDRQAPDGTLRLGSEGRPSHPTVDLADPALAGEPSATQSGSDHGLVTVWLWRGATPGAAVAPAPLDDATRERLRRLGYLE